MANKSPIPATSVGGRDFNQVAVVFRPDIVPLDLAVPAQVFGAWPPRVADLLGLDASPYTLSVVGSQGAGDPGAWLQVPAVQPLSALDEAGTIVVPGVFDPLAPVEGDLVVALRDAHADGARILSICTGAFALASAGLLDGRVATTHWMWTDELRRRHPAIEVREWELYIDDGDIVTSAGVLAGTDLCLHIVRRDHGQHMANMLSRFLVSPPHREGGQAQYMVGKNAPYREDLAALTTWIRAHLADELTLDTVAKQAHLSVRTLTRHFRTATGHTVMDWVASERIAKARELLETTNIPVTTIAATCGFGSLEAFRTQFAERTLTSPTNYRMTFR